MSRRALATAAVLAIVIGSTGIGWLGWNLAMAGPGGCPAALLQGTLVEKGGTLAVRASWSGVAVDVTWPFGYGVRREDDGLVLTRVFSVVAREGDEVSMGGGSANDDSRFLACGPVSLGLAIPEDSPEVTPPPDQTDPPRSIRP